MLLAKMRCIGGNPRRAGTGRYIEVHEGPLIESTTGSSGSPVRIEAPKLIRRVVTNPSFGLVPLMPLVSLGGSWCFVLLRDAIVGIYLQLHRWRGSARA